MCAHFLETNSVRVRSRCQREKGAKGVLHFEGGVDRVTRGKRRTDAEENRLRILVERGEKLDAIAEALNREPAAVSMKLSRMGLKVVVEKKTAKKQSTTSAVLPKDLISHERALFYSAMGLSVVQRVGFEPTNACATGS